MIASLEIHVTGFVQGVGFRPSVFIIARDLGMHGTVANTPEGVRIRCTIPAHLNAQTTLSQIKTKIDERGFNVTSYHCREISPLTDTAFKIIPSTQGQASLYLPPDVGICGDCIQEWADPSQRRHGYAFISCTQCGCRYTWMHHTPYDRESLSIDQFPQCDKCLSEYTDPDDRRFHAQTNTCPDCGPTLTLFEAESSATNAAAIKRVHQLLSSGEIVAVKGIGGFLLTCDARCDSAVQLLRKIKGRDSKPFAVLFNSETQLSQYHKPTAAELQKLHSPSRPIVLIEKSSSAQKLSRHISAGLAHEGCFLPASSLLLSLTSHFPLIATSANLTGEPILTTLVETQDRFSEKISAILDYNLQIHFPCDDSVIRLDSHNTPIILRTGRGLAPLSRPSQLTAAGSNTPQSIAMGAQERAGISCQLNGMLYTSGYIADLENYDSQVRFNELVRRWLTMLDFQPQQIIIDKHPEYHSSIFGRQLASELGAEIIEVQHHEAHFASVLHENDLLETTQPTLGVIWDGSGFGTDHTIWGSEFFTYQDHRITRIAHLQPVPLLCGERMVREPKISAIAYTGKIDPTFKHHFTPQESTLLASKLSKQEGTPSSSMGRLFDAAAFILCGCETNHYSGDAAIQLEKIAHQHLRENPSSDLTQLPLGDQPHTLDGSLLIHALIHARKNHQDPGYLAASFHFTLIKKIATIARAAGTHSICFSGGVFQNKILHQLAQQHLSKEFKLYHHLNLSANDDSISHGQIIHAHLQSIHNNNNNNHLTSTNKSLCV